MLRKVGWVRSEVRDLSRYRTEQRHVALINIEEWKLKEGRVFIEEFLNRMFWKGSKIVYEDGALAAAVAGCCV